MGVPSHDLSNWPLVIITAPPEAASDDDMRAHLERVRALYQRGEPFSLVVDVRAAPQPPPHQRRLLSDALAEHEARHPRMLRGLAMIVASPIQRGVITAIAWMFPPPYPMRVFSELEPARAWGAALLDSAHPMSP